MSELSKAQQVGWVIVLVYLALTVAASVAVVTTYSLQRGTDRLPLQLVRIVLTVVLCVFLYRGSRVAKWVAVVLFTIGGALALPQVLSDEPLVVGVVGGLAVLYLSFAAVLIASPRVNAFLNRDRHPATPAG